MDKETGQLELYMYGIPPGRRLYMGLSGGLDSAYLAWRLLSLGYPLLLHHCTYKTGQNRWPREEEAYQAILAWLQEQGLRDWSLLRTELDARGTIPYWFRDYEYLWWIAGVHLRKHRDNQDRQDISDIVIPSHRESESMGSRDLQRAYHTLTYTARRHIRPVHPMQSYDRPAILGDMPRELIDLCWWCRRPRDGKPCRQCNTCAVVYPAFEKIGYVHPSG